jgi:hypothetical protein
MLKRGGGAEGRSVAASWDKMVSGVWRYAPIAVGSVGYAADGKIFIAHRA